MNHYRIIYSLIVVTLLITSCSSDPWSEAEQDEFINSCTAESVEKERCECMMNETMQRYPRYEEARDISFEEAVEVAELCR